MCNLYTKITNGPLSRIIGKISMLTVYNMSTILMENQLERFSITDLIIPMGFPCLFYC